MTKVASVQTTQLVHLHCPCFRVAAMVTVRFQGTFPISGSIIITAELSLPVSESCQVYICYQAACMNPNNLMTAKWIEPEHTASPWYSGELASCSGLP
jgi:hypothetical protein